MASHDPASMADRQPLAFDAHGHFFTDQPPGHAIAVGVDLDTGLGTDDAAQFPCLGVGRATIQRGQRCAFIPLEAQARCLAGAAVAARVGDFPLPQRQVGFQCRPTGEGAAGQGVLLGIADAILVFALGPWAVGGAGFGGEAPVSGEGVEAFVEHDFAGLDVVAVYQGTGVVHQDFTRDAAEMGKGTFHAGEPGGLAFRVGRVIAPIRGAWWSLADSRLPRHVIGAKWGADCPY